MLLVAAILTLRFAVLPNVENYRTDIVKNVSSATGMAVSAGVLSGGWQGFRPFVELNDVRFSDPKSAGDVPALILPSLHASLSWWSLFIGEISFNEVILDGPELSLRRAEDGGIYFAGKSLNKKNDGGDGQIIDWLLEQPHLSVQNATLLWQDDMANVPAMQLTKVDLRVEKRGKRHRLGLRATPPRGLAASLDAQGDLVIGKIAQQWAISGTLFAMTTQADLAEFRRHLPIPGMVGEATGNVRTWIDLDSAQPLGVKSITADISVMNAMAQFSKDLAPLSLARLAGRVEYRTEPGGFAIASRGLQFRTRDGIQLAPADFSVALAAEPGKVAQGQVSGNAIDLKVIAALIHYFPVGKDVREVVARFAPRGMVNQADVSWNGEFPKVQSYRVKGRFVDLALSADAGIPGVQGLSGSVEGDERGGRISIASKNLTMDMNHVFRAPLFFDALDIEANWKKDAESLALDFSKIDFANADGAGLVSGTYRTGGKGPGVVNLKGKLLRGNAGRLANYLPNNVQQTRTWLETAIMAGKIKSAELELSGDLGDFPFQDEKTGKYLVTAKIEGVRLKFLPDWPAIDDITGEMVVSGAHIKVLAESARIFDASIGRTTVELDDTTSWTPQLAINGTAKAPAQDVARYLRESPLSEGVGKFVQVLALEGPGKLDLNLSIPLGAPENPGGANAKARPPLRVEGRYEFIKARVKPPMGATVTNVNGVVQFNERSVKSQGLTGTVYGNPLQIVISGAGDEGVVTELAGRAEVVNLNDVLPFNLPIQVSGVADWKGRLVTRASRTDMVFTSDLIGVASTLPSPLAKSVESPMKLVAEFSDVGKSAERIHVQLGDVAYARFARRFDEKGQSLGVGGGLVSLERPIGAQPLPEGLWLTGNMRDLDIDRWKDTFGATAANLGAASGNDTRGSNTFTGFDLAVTRMLAFGREFKGLQMRGRRAGDDWRVTVESPELSGDALWRPAAEGGRGSIRARLTNFVLNTEQPGGNTPPVASNQNVGNEFPALDIEAERFRFRGYDLGKLEFRAAMDGADWRIDRLAIEGDGSKLDTQGRWTREGSQSHSELKVKLESKNLNGLFRTFGHADTLRRGSGQLEGSLSWPGYPYEFALNNLVGDFKLEGKNGQFAKIEPGAGRLLGLLSLQSIPRRITLDFRDIFSDGFAFDRINGTVKIDKGVMRTENFEIVGPAAFVTMQGDVSLPNETQNLRVAVIPSLGEGVSILTGFLINPAVGLGTLLVQKLLQDPLGKAAAYQYTVTGTWETPDVLRVGRPEPPAANVNVPSKEPGNTAASAATQNKISP